MPRIVNEIMTKIIQNAPYAETNDSIEESKTAAGKADPEEVKVEFPAEKPWLKKKTKIYDSERYT